MHRVMTELAARVVEEQRQAELIQALTDQIADLQTLLADYQEAAWLFEELELAAGERHVLISKHCDGKEVWLGVRHRLFKAPSLREAAMAAFEK